MQRVKTDIVSRYIFVAIFDLRLQPFCFLFVSDLIERHVHRLVFSAEVVSAALAQARRSFLCFLARLALRG